MSAFDDIAACYDRFIDWPQRLARELPPLEKWLGKARRVADVACGTGGHSLALARDGYEVVGFDLSAPMLERARAQVDSLPVRFVEAAFGQLAASGDGDFDAVLCLGNALPSLLTQRDLRRTLADFRRLLRPGGRALVGLRNLPRAAAAGERWLPLKSHRDEDGAEWLFERLYDLGPRGRLTFHFIELHRAVGGAWQRRVTSNRLRAWGLDDLMSAMSDWSDVEAWADLAGTAFDGATSGDLFLSARRP